jgi:hypothetical protein
MMGNQSQTIQESEILPLLTLYQAVALDSQRLPVGA